MNVAPTVLASMLDAVQEGVYHTDLERTILHWNASAHRITGHDAPSVALKPCRDRIVRHVDGQGHELCSTPRCPLLVPQRTGKPHHADLFLHHQEGHLVPVSVRSLPVQVDGQLTGVTLLFEEKKSHEDGLAEWKKAALTDSLTGLGNRRSFRQAWTRNHRALIARGVAFGVLLVDVDHFKHVNDVHGHPVGDRVLRMVARTLAASTREGDVVVRWGGEEFLLVVPGAGKDQLADLAERVRRMVEKAWTPLASGEHLSVTVSVGGALVAPGDSPHDVVARADERLLFCKATGRNRSSISVAE